MKLRIKWKYPDENAIHERTYFDIDPQSITITNGFLLFAKENHGAELKFQIDHVVRMTLEEE